MTVDTAAKLMILGFITLLAAIASAARLLYVLSGSTDSPDASSTVITVVQIGVTMLLAAALIVLGARLRVRSRHASPS